MLSRRHVAAAAVALAVVASWPLDIVPTAPVTRTLVVAVRPGPASWYTAAHGARVGFDHDLLARYAAARGFELQIVEVDSAEAIFAKLAAGEAHIGIGGLYPPAPSHVKADAAIPDPRPALWTNGSFPVEPVLVYNRRAAKPRAWRDMGPVDVAYSIATGIEHHFAAARAAYAHIRFRAPDLDAHALLAHIAGGGAAFAIVPMVDAIAARNLYAGLEIAFAVGPKRDQAWAVAPALRLLRDDIDRYLTAARKEGVLVRLAERYFEPAGQVEHTDAAIFQERVQSLLPRYRPLFEQAEAATGVEWRLIAAIAYQESQWDPQATSETGVRGFMQITEDTAARLRIADRLDPVASVLGAARYYADLKARLPARIAEPDRTYLALAAFNIGGGHLEDGRVLAQRLKLNPDAWADVRRALPLLALPEHGALARNGVARGGMPVAFVDRVRAYHDILLRQAPPAPDPVLVASIR